MGLQDDEQFVPAFEMEDAADSDHAEESDWLCNVYQCLPMIVVRIDFDWNVAKLPYCTDSLLYIAVGNM